MLLEELESLLITLKNNILKFKNELLFFENKDDSVVVVLHSGQGGVEAQDWTEMLKHMILKFIQSHSFEVLSINDTVGKNSGLKNCIIELKGLNLYTKLKVLNGVHRIQRFSPHDTNEQRHTSFASIFIYPLKENISLEEEIIIDNNILKRETFRSGGPGGQNVNKVETAVRLIYPYKDKNSTIHKIVVSCQEERSQYQNYERCLKKLKIHIQGINKQLEQDILEKEEKNKKKNSWSNQIITYVYNPYTLVKDHRTGYKTSHIDAIMNGELDDLITTFLEQHL